MILIPRLILTSFLYIKKLRFIKPSSNVYKIIRFNEKKFKMFLPKICFVPRFFFYMFDIQLGQLPPLCPAHALKES